MVGITTKVTCKKCGKSFDYEFIPGGSFTSVRLGKYRYMKCQKCGKWGLFDITEGLSGNQKNHLGSSSAIGGIAMLVLGIFLLYRGTAMGIFTLDITGVAVLVIALLMVLMGRSIRK